MNDNKNDGLVPCKKSKYTQCNTGDASYRKIKDNVLSCSKADTEAGAYFLGPSMKKYLCAPVAVCIGRKKCTDEYYLMKMLVLDDTDTSDRGLYVRRAFFHNEYRILSMLKNNEGVVRLHDFFKDYIYKEVNGKEEKYKRVFMALDCIYPHGSHNSDLIPLCQLLKEKKLSETESLHILYNLLLVIESLHKMNIVHREIKLSNVIVNKKTLKVKLMDFYYAKVLSVNEVYNKDSCCPRSSDVWAAGVVFYAMLCSGNAKFGSLLSSSSIHTMRDLYLKLEQNKNCLFKNNLINVGTKEILYCILCSLPDHQLEAHQALDMVSTLFAIQSSSQNLNSSIESKNTDQVVPECLDFVSKKTKSHQNKKSKINYENCSVKVPEMNDIENSNEECNTSKKNLDDYEVNKNIMNFNEISVGPTSKFKEDKEIKKDNIKFAMMRLGATSLQSINALSFNYSKKNSCPL